MIKNITIGDLTIDCTDACRTREFYGELTGWEKMIAYDCLALKAHNGMILLFEEPDFVPYDPPIWPEKSGKQQKQMHFDFHVDDLPTAVEEAIRLGASKSVVQFGGDQFITMLDPEGRPFCLCKTKYA